MNVVWISNKLFMCSLILLMLVFIWHGFGWKRLFVWRQLMDERSRDINDLRQSVEEESKEKRHDDVRITTALRNPLLWIALAGIAVSIVITL